MKKVNLLLTFLFCLALFSCSNDDDGGSSALKCFDCNVNTLGLPDDIEYCDNGDGTMDVLTKSTGKTITVSLMGNTFAEFIATARTFGTCTEQ